MNLIELMEGFYGHAKGKGGIIMRRKITDLTQHPVRKDLYGEVWISPVGIYYMKMGHVVVTCPQHWAAALDAK